MATEVLCRRVQERLTEDCFAGRDARDEDAAHAETCDDCRALRADLLRLARALAAAPELPADTAATIRRRVAAELARVAGSRVAPSAARAGLPHHYGRELLRLLFWVAIPLPLVLFVDVQLFRAGGRLLSEFLPAFAVDLLGIAAATCIASWMALIYGAIPFVAQRRLSARAGRTTPGLEVNP